MMEKQNNTLSHEELFEKKRTFMFDIECYSNFFLADFMCYETGKTISFERSPSSEINLADLDWILNNFLIVGFNSKNYDIPMLFAARSGLYTNELKTLSDELIKEDFQIGKAEKKWKFKVGFCNHVDIQEVAPGVMIGLKQYAGRMHLQKLQDLPFDPNSELTQEQAIQIREYCKNDLEITAYLYSRLEQSIQLREQMGLDYELDLRSKSDAQIAESVLKNEIESRKGKRISRPKKDSTAILKYKVPDYIKPKTESLKSILQIIKKAEFELDEGGRPKMPDSIRKAKIQIGNSLYNMGIGGLHSTEKSQCFVSNDEYVLVDRDVASYYPQIILNQKLYPDHIGKEFLDVYQSIVDKRLKAKATPGDIAKSTADSLKITINGAFGKLGSQYSCLYAPQLLLQVTLTGQLSLLLLIEMIENRGISVVSANTDGIVVKLPIHREFDFQEEIDQWEKITGFTTEETVYQSIYSRDVNNYIAIGNNGDFKAKGSYVCDLSMKNKNRESLMKNPEFTICNEAVMLFLRDGTSIEKTIRTCQDIRKFVAVRRVKGGAVKNGKYLGKVVRWYIQEGEFGIIEYAKNGNKVPNSDGGCPVMNFEDFPNDINYEWYHERCFGILKDLGYGRKVEVQLGLF